MSGSKKNNQGIRLQKYLSSCGIASRRACEEIIAEGRVKVNRKTVTQPGVSVYPGDEVTVDGNKAAPREKYYFALNKPKGYLSSNYDPHHRLFARDLIDIPDRNVLFHVGRLDLYSTGLILYTNDGEFANKLMHPSYEAEKEYRVSTREKISAKDIDSCLKGVQLNCGIVYNIKRYTFVSEREILLVLTEGKNREIRNLFNHFGYTITSLHRMRIGPIQLGNLQPGRYKEIKRDVVQQVLNYVVKKE